MAATIVYKAFKVWQRVALELPESYWSVQSIKHHGELRGSGVIFSHNTFPIDRSWQWMDYICLRDGLNYRKTPEGRDYERLTEDQREWIATRIEKEF